ncbi:MAG TPA: hypothetical protein VGO15_10790, partial [Candidatus Limnocylindrales bacterium]|nr:hypothetical protein [Candidatus Limnocylindrales bacterium]
MNAPAQEGRDPASEARLVVATLLAILIVALVAWLVPPAAIVLVWPMLFFIPGWVVVQRVVPDLPRPGAVGVAVVSSVYLSAHLVNVVARVGGFGRASIVETAVILAVGALVVARLRHPLLAPLARPSASGV